MSGFKQRVKNGNLSPERALREMLAKASNPKQAANSRTARWMRSETASKRFKAANKGA
jgi:hypothetical protein